MKQTITLLALQCLLFFASKAQTSYIHPQSLGSTHFYFTGDDSFYMYGEKGNNFNRMYKFSNTHEWEVLNRENFVDKFNTFVVNGKNGVALKYNGWVYHTQDHFATTSLVADLYLDKVYASSYGFVGHKTSKGLYFSKDGLTWTKSLNPSRVLAHNKNFVAALGSKQTNYLSADGGENWTAIAPGKTTALNIINIINSDTLFALDAAKNLVVTYDAFETIKTMPLPTIPNTIKFFDSKRGILTNTINNVVYVTTTGGSEWAQIPLPQGMAKPELAEIAGKSLFLIGGGKVFRSQDMGQSWEHIYEPIATDLLDIELKNDIGVISGERGYFAITHNGGLSFFTGPTLASTEDLMACGVVNDTTLLIGDRKGRVFISFDKGMTWEQKNKNNANYFVKSFTSSSDGKFICAERYGQPMISTDYGQSFKVYTVGGGTHYLDLYEDGGLFDLRGINGFILEKRQATSYTNRQEIARLREVTSVPKRLYMINDDQGYLICHSGNSSGNMHVYTTTDGWKTFSNSAPDIGFSISGYPSVFSNGTDSVMVSIAGFNRVLFSKNKGKDWIYKDVDAFAQIDDRNYAVSGSHFISWDHFFLVSEDGMIVTQSNANGIKTGQEIVKPEDTHLLAYPNPASQILYLNKAQGGTLKIFDQLGQLKMELKHPTSNQINIAHLPQGLYILTLQTNNKTESTKFLKQ